MDIEKLIESVRLCGSTPRVDQCKQCAYWSGGDMSKCIPRMTTDAVTALSTLQAENEKLRTELERMTTERDAAVEYLRGQCRYCKRNLVCTNRKGPHFNCWEWRGQKEE